MATDTVEKLETELFPPPGDPTLGHKVLQVLKEILDDKKAQGLPELWSKNYNLRRANHWKKNRKKSLVSANLLGAHSQRTVNMLTDNNPTFNVSRLGDPGDFEEDIFDTISHTCEHWWREQEQQDVLEKSVSNGEMYGCTIEKVIFDADLEFGLGEAQTEVIDPFYFGVYPVSCQDSQRADANFHFYPMSAREARRRWPDKAALLKGDMECLQDLGDERQEMVSGAKTSGGYFAAFAGVIKHIFNAVDGDGSESDDILIVECWCKDYTMDVVMEETEDGEIVEVSRPKYPGNIRVITMANGGNVILDDRSNPNVSPTLSEEMARKTYLYDHYPFTLIPSVKDSISPWGMSDYAQLEGLQIEYNKSLSQFGLFKDRVSRAKIINPKNSGVPNSAFTNIAGILNPTTAQAGAGIRYMDPPEYPIDIEKGIALIKEQFFLVSGSFELEQAHSPGRDVIAYQAIAALLERATLMLKGKLRNYGKLVRERGRMYISMAQNFYTEERWISYEDDGESASTSITGERLIVPAKLTVVSGSTMPRSKVQEREEAIGLFREGAIDFEELLKALEWKNRRAVVKRMKAGPMGELIERLAGIGAPEPLIQYMQELSELEQKEFESLLENGKTADFYDLVGEEPAGPDMTEVEAADIEVKRAQARKLEAEQRLVEEKIKTERVEQQVKQQGVNLDRETLKLDKYKAIQDAKQRERDSKRQAAGGGSSDRKKNNATKRGPSPKKANKRSQGPYRERGMKSNNKKVGERR